MNDGIKWEAANEAYIDGRIAVAAKLITGTPMEPNEEAGFVVPEIVKAALGDEPAYREPTEHCDHRYLQVGHCRECGAALRWVRQFWPEVTE